MIVHNMLETFIKSVRLLYLFCGGLVWTTSMVAPSDHRHTWEILSTVDVGPRPGLS